MTKKTPKKRIKLVPVYVLPHVHRLLKIEAAKAGQTIGDYLVDLLPGSGWRQ